MSARSVSFGSMFGWIPASLALVRRNPAGMATATLVTILAAALLLLPMGVLMFKTLGAAGPAAPGLPPVADMKLFFTIYAASIVLMLLLMPPLVAGWFRLCEATDRGATPGGLQVLKPYSDLPAWMRLVGFALLAMLMYIAAFAVFALLFGGLFAEMMAMQAAQQAAVFAGTPPPAPEFATIGKLLLAYAVVLPVSMLLQIIYMVGFAEVSLRSTPVLTAFKDASVGVLRNLLKLLVFMFCLGGIFGAVMFVLVLVLGLLAMLLAFLSPVLMAIVVGLFYLAMLLVLYPLMFAGNYQVWKSMLGGGPPAVPDSMAA